MLIPILIAIAILILAGLAVVLVARMQQKTRSRTIQIEIHNLGNVQSRYELQATDPEGSLKFQFTLDGDALPQAAERAEEKHPQRAPSVQASVPAVQQPVITASREEGVGNQVMEGGGIVASMLSTLGLLLPRSLGAPLTRAASQMRRTQLTVSRAQQLKGQGNKLKSKASPRRGKRAQPATSGQAEPPYSGTQFVATQAEQVGDGGLLWAQTPSVEPDGVLMVDLEVSSAPPSLWRSSSEGKTGQDYPFTVISRSAELHEPVGQTPAVTAEASVQFPGASRFLRLLPYVVILAIAVCLLVLTFLLGGTL